MKHSLGDWFKNAILISIGLIAVSGLLLSSYLKSHDMNFDEFFEGDNFHFNIDTDNYNGRIGFFHIGDGEKSSRYERLTRHEEDVFEVKDEIRLNLTNETVRFVYEDREDILIVFDRQLPDTPSYILDYKASEHTNYILVDVELTLKNLYTDVAYPGTLTLHVPKEYECKRFVVNNPFGSYNGDLPKSLEELDLSLSFGDLDIAINQPLKKALLHVNAGNLSVEVNQPIEILSIDVDTGEVRVDLNDLVQSLSVEANVGTMTVNANRSPLIMSVVTNLGDMNLSFDEPIESLDVQMNIGDISLDVASDDRGIVYIKDDLASVTSKLTTTDRQDKANIWVEINMGELTVR